MPSDISKFNVSIAARYQDTAKSAICIDPKTSWFWSVEICLEFLQVLSYVSNDFFFQSSERKFDFWEHICDVSFAVNSRRASGMGFPYTDIWVCDAFISYLSITS